MAERWGYFSLDAGQPSWLVEIAYAVAKISAALTWVHREQASWESCHPLPANLDANARAQPRRVWLLEPPLADAREELEQLGFQLTGPVAAPPTPATFSEQDRELLRMVFARAEHEPYLCAVDEPGFPAHRVDGWNPNEQIALDVEWSSDRWSQPAAQAASLMKLDVRYLFLARHHSSAYRAVERLLEATFADPSTAVALSASSLPLRGVVLASI